MIQKDNALRGNGLTATDKFDTQPGAPGRWIQVISLAMIIVAVALLVISCFRVPTDADSFFHLATARNWFEYGLSPFVDHLTFTHFEEPVKNQPVVFQALLYGYVEMFGLETGYALFKLTFMLLTLATIGWLARQTRAPWPLAALAIAILVFALQTRVQARPELGIFWFTALAMVFYHRTLEGRRPGVNATNMIPIVVLMVVWVAWYTAIFAYVIFFGLFLDLAIRQWQSGARLKEWMHWLAWGLLVLILGWGPPDFSHDLISTLTFSREWTQLIGEWAPPVRFFKMSGTWVLALAGAAAIFLCVRCRSIGLLIVLVVFIQQTTQISRLIAPAGIVITASLLHLFALARKNHTVPERPNPGDGKLSGVIVTLGILALASSAYLTTIHLNWGEWRGAAWPKHMAQHLQKAWSPGRILNPMIRGGYFAYELGPEYKIYIDGRVNLLFSLEFFKHHLNVFRSSSELQSELNRYEVDYLVVPDDVTADRYLHGLEGWKLEFVDVNDLLFVRDHGRFEVSGQLRIAPECWDSSLAGLLREEHNTARAILPAENSLSPLIQNMLRYGENDPAMLESVVDDLEHSDDWRSARFFAYRASDLGKHDLVIRLLSDQPYWYFKDGLVLALAYLESGQIENANTLIARLLSGSWLQFDQNDLSFLAAIFAELERQGGVRNFNVESVRQFFAQNGHWPPRIDLNRFLTSDLCYERIVK